MPSDVSWTFSTGAGLGCPCTIWPDTATPAVAADPSAGAIELGVKWRAEVDGFVTGLRFYKGPGNTGPHIGNVWTSTGTLLGERHVHRRDHIGLAAGRRCRPRSPCSPTRPTWRRITRRPDISRQRRTTSPRPASTRRRCMRWRTASSGGNGVFIASATSAFPDPVVLLDQLLGRRRVRHDRRRPTPLRRRSTPVTPAAGATGVSAGANVVATFSERMNPASHHHLDGRTAHGVQRAGDRDAVSYNDLTRTATLDPTGPLANLATYTATVKGGATGVKDVAGNPLAADFTWTFTTGAAAMLSLHDLARHRDARGRCRPVRRRNRAGREVAGRGGRVRHRSAVLQGPRQHRAAHRQPVDEHRDAARQRHVHRRDRLGLAAGRRCRRRSPSSPTRPTWRRITRRPDISRPRRTCSPRPASTRRRCMRWRTASSGGNGVFIAERDQRVPDAVVQLDQLLGRRRVRHVDRPRHHTTDDQLR